MKLTVLLGPAGSGKTFRCLEGLRGAERNGRRGLLFVPDQFTYAADRLLFEGEGFSGTRKVRILSFSRLAHLVCRQPAISEMGRRMLLRRVVHEMDRETLGPVANLRGQIGLVDALASAIKELRAIAGPHTASRLADAAGDDAKLISLSEIIAAYDRHLGAAGQVDPQDRHHLAAGLLAGSGFGDGAPVWVDGFASFTPAEKALLEALLTIASETTITLCCDPADAKTARGLVAERTPHGVVPGSPEFMRELRSGLPRPVFLPTLRTLLWLDTISGGSGATEGLPSSDPRFDAQPALGEIARGLFLRTASVKPAAADSSTAGATATGSTAADSSTAVSIDSPAHPYEEVRDWACKIDRWTRLSDEPIRYRDIALLVRDIEAYRPLIKEIFGRYGISYFIDERRDITAHPIVRFHLSALELAASGWSRENVLSILRNPLLGLSPMACDLLENLSLEYGIEYDVWFQTRWETYRLPDREQFEVDPADDPEEGADADRLQAKVDRDETRRDLSAKCIRAEIQPLTERLRQFSSAWSDDGGSFAEGSAALRSLLVDCLRLAGTGDRPPPFEESWSSEEEEQIRTLLEGTLDLGEELLGGLAMDVHLFAKLMRDALTGATVGVTPRSLDAVVVAEPRRARVNEVRRVILGGAQAGSFPRVPVPDPVLTDPDREQLTAQGLPIMPVADTHVEEDPYLFYIACTRATERLWVTRPRTDLSGDPTEPSPYLRDLARAAGVADWKSAAMKPSPDKAIQPLRDCVHASELAASLAAASASMTPPDRAALFQSVEEKLAPEPGILTQADHCAAQVHDPLPHRLAPEVLDDLYREGIIQTSASGLETFARCPYQYFARQVLRLEPRPEAVLTPRSTGSAVHEALSLLFRPGELPPNEDEAAKAARAIFDRLSQREEYDIFKVHPPSAYQWDRTGRHLQLFARTETRRLHQGNIQPAGAELGFGLTGEADQLQRLRDILGDRLSVSLLPGAKALPSLDLTLPADLIGRDAPGGENRWLVRLRGRIDRLDVSQTEGGGFKAVVIDYKSSISYKNVLEGLPLGTDLQIAVYLLVAKELGLIPAAGLYYSFKPSSRTEGESFKDANLYKFGIKGLYSTAIAASVDPEGAFGLRGTEKKPKGLTDEGLEGQLEAARRQIRLLTTGILCGHVRPYPVSQKDKLPCEHCDFAPMCRFRASTHATRSSIPGGEDEA